jgi:hypothetical protein
MIQFLNRAVARQVVALSNGYQKVYMPDSLPVVGKGTPLTHEIHLDDCENVARKAKKQGVDVILSKWPSALS